MNPFINSMTQWMKTLFDNEKRKLNVDADDDAEKPDWARVWPFIAIHVACIGVIWVGVSPIALVICVLSYGIRMFAITGFYHRYFSHKAFKTSRTVQFFFALLGASATQRGPLWWAAHHRHHHRHADTDLDLHAPVKGFWQSHCGWFLSRKGFEAPSHLIRDFSQFAELRFIDRYDMLVPVAYGLILFGIGELLRIFAPSLKTSGLQVFMWGYLISTVLLIHATLFINSLAHRWGTRRYKTRDQSRNNLLLALITLGEGWHNNHHHYAGSAKQGFFWWEVDISFYLLKMMSSVGLVWDLKEVPDAKKMSHKQVEYRNETISNAEKVTL